MVVLTTQDELRDVKHEEGVCFKCCECQQVKPVNTPPECSTGYGYDDRKKPICFECCGKRDLKHMTEEGRITLYLKCESSRKMRDKNNKPFTIHTINESPGREARGTVTNWPGTLSFNCYTTVGRHNIAGVRYDCWFKGPDGFEWHGVTYGENTQLCHCKRTKKKL